MAKKNFRGVYLSGMSGLALPIPKYKFPPEFEKASRLTYYAAHFSTIEINRSFYTLPNPRTLVKWSNEVPESFRFTFKLWKQITHNKGLKFEASDVKLFIDAISSVGEKRGCLLIQFPPSLKSDSLLNLEHLLAVIQEYDPDQLWKIAVEFRDNSWYSEETIEIINTFGASIVVHDKRRTNSLELASESNTVYVRFHGPKGDYRGSYEDDFLHEYASYISDWLTDGKNVFVYFNNTMGDAFANLEKLNRYVLG